MSEQEEIIESVEKAKAPGTFNILEVLQNRGYPESTVEVYMDEASMYKISEIKERLEELDKAVSKKSETAKQKKEREDLLSEEDDLFAKLDASKFTVHLVGIPEGKREDLFRQSVKKYPIEYELQGGVTSLLSGDQNKVEKESPQRDALFTDYLWQAHIKKIVNPDGDEQTEFSYSTIRTMRETFPLGAMVRINSGIEKIRSATALFTVSTGEDFLAKP